MIGGIDGKVSMDRFMLHDWDEPTQKCLLCGTTKREAASIFHGETWYPSGRDKFTVHSVDSEGKLGR